MAQYKSILKATSIFGGTQIIQLIIQLVRSKFVAILVGATGIGLSSMYMTSLSMIITIFGMGINTSVVRDLSKYNDEGDEYKFALIIKVFRRMLLVLSFLGMLCVIILSKCLSLWSFGNDAHIIHYCFLSSIVLFTLLSQGNTSVLIGKRRIKEVAKCTLIGSLVTLFTSVPFFYFWRLDGIVPGLVVSTFFNYIITYYYSRKVKIAELKIAWRDVRIYGLSILDLGFSLVIAVILGNITVYLINISITKLGGLQDLGFYNAGMSMTQQVISMVFAAMAADYYPRLVASLKSKTAMSETINEQSEVLVHLSAPVLAFFSIFSPIIIRLLLSSEFLVINSFIRILCFGMFLKAICYALGYVSFAKGDKWVYLLYEGGYGNFMNLIASVGFYYLFGLKGIAIAFVLTGALGYLFINLIDKYRYGYRNSNKTFRVVGLNMLLMALLLLSDCYTSDVMYYAISIPLTLVCVAYNLKELNNKTQVVDTVKSRIFKIHERI